MRLVDKHQVQDIFVERLVRVDVIEGGFARFLLCSERTGEDGEPELHVVVRIVMPVVTVRPAVDLTLAALARNAVRGVRRVFAHLH